MKNGDGANLLFLKSTSASLCFLLAASLGTFFFADSAKAVPRTRGGMLLIVALITPKKGKDIPLHAHVALGELTNRGEIKMAEKERYNLGSLSDVLRHLDEPTYSMMCGGHVLYNLINGARSLYKPRKPPHWICNGNFPRTLTPAFEVAKIIHKLGAATVVTDPPQVYDIVYWSEQPIDRIIQASSREGQHISVVIDAPGDGSATLATKDEWESTFLIKYSSMSESEMKSKGFGGASGKGMNRYKAARRYRVPAGLKVQWFYWTPTYKNPSGPNFKGHWRDKNNRPILIQQTDRLRNAPLVFQQNDSGGQLQICRGAFENAKTLYRTKWETRKTIPTDELKPAMIELRGLYEPSASKIEWQTWKDNAKPVTVEIWHREGSFNAADFLAIDKRFMPNASGRRTSLLSHYKAGNASVKFEINDLRMNDPDIAKAWQKFVRGIAGKFPPGASIGETTTKRGRKFFHQYIDASTSGDLIYFYRSSRFEDPKTGRTSSDFTECTMMKNVNNRFYVVVSYTNYGVYRADIMNYLRSLITAGEALIAKKFPK